MPHPSPTCLACRHEFWTWELLSPKALRHHQRAVRGTDAPEHPALWLRPTTSLILFCGDNLSPRRQEAPGLQLFMQQRPRTCSWIRQEQVLRLRSKTTSFLPATEEAHPTPPHPTYHLQLATVPQLTFTYAPILLSLKPCLEEWGINGRRANSSVAVSSKRPSWLPMQWDGTG